MVKKSGIQKLLGLSEESWLYNLYYKFRKHMTLMRTLSLIILVLMILSTFLFAHLEILPRKDFQQFTKGSQVNSYLLSVYWLITTMTSVGYGDIVPVTGPGRVVGAFVMLLGLLFVSLLISQLTSWIVAKNLSSMFGISKTRKRIDLVICGWNPTTEATLSELNKGDMEIVLIDKNNVSEAAKANKVMFVMGDPTQVDVLEKANVEHARNLVLALEHDSDTLLATHVIRDLNPYINLIVKINNHEHVDLAKKAGADHVVSPSSIGGRLLSIVAKESHVVEWVIEATTTRKGVTLVEYDINAKSPYVNKTLGQIRKELGKKAKILGVETSAGFERIPSDEIKVLPGTKIIAIARKN